MNKVNNVTVGLTIFSVLLAIFTTKYLTKYFVKSSVQHPLIHTASPLPTIKVTAKSLFVAPSPFPTVQVVVIANRQKVKSPTPHPPVPDWASAKSLPIASRQPGKQNLEVIYNLKTPPKFKYSQKLQTIVDDVVELATIQSLPKKPLSITLIDTKNSEIAGYQQNTPRYPASVVKMFWMAILYAQIESGFWKNEKEFTPYLAKMINESDNEAASFIVDQITGTRSEPTLKSEKFKLWRNKRQQLNRFFQQAGYKKINISQKTFPIDYINLQEPDGSEFQILNNPTGNSNKITTKHAARLLYEICYTQQAVSPQASKKMCGLLKRDLNPKVWRSPNYYDFNPVRTFFGESLSHAPVQLHSKAGWTSISRAEAAIVVTEDRKTTYILTIFAQHSAYADDVDIFPKISRLVYKRMTSRSLK